MTAEQAQDNCDNIILMTDEEKLTLIRDEIVDASKKGWRTVRISARLISGLNKRLEDDGFQVYYYGTDSYDVKW